MPAAGATVERRFTTQQAVQVCESSIRQQAEQRFRTQNINFRGTALDNNPGRQDWVMGMFDVRTLAPVGMRPTASLVRSILTPGRSALHKSKPERVIDRLQLWSGGRSFWVDPPLTLPPSLHQAGVS